MYIHEEMLFFVFMLILVQSADKKGDNHNAHQRETSTVILHRKYVHAHITNPKEIHAHIDNILLVIKTGSFIKKEGQ